MFSNMQENITPIENLVRRLIKTREEWIEYFEVSERWTQLYRDLKASNVLIVRALHLFCRTLELVPHPSLRKDWKQPVGKVRIKN